MKKLLKNKTILYIVLFITVTNVMGYLMVNNVDAIILLFLVGLLTSYFSKNMIVVMLAAIVFTNLLVGSKVASRTPLLEGFKTEVNMAKDAMDQAEQDVMDAKAELEKVEEEDNSDIDILEAKKNLEEAKKIAKEKTDEYKAKERESKIKAKKREMKIKKKEIEIKKEEGEEEGEEDGGVNDCDPEDHNCKSPFTNLSPASLVENDKASELDFPGSIEAAYDNLDKLLSSDAINKMSKDTQNLADKQRKLMGNIDKLGPLMENAKKMMDGLNTGKLDKLLSGYLPQN